MLDAFESAFAAVQELVKTFDANKSFYLSPAYQEQEARRDFIDKFWIALGWDVNHDAQKNPYEQEVKVERKEHGSSQSRADYAFYLAPNFRDVKFFVEAKRPAGEIATRENYFQAVSYGWSATTPLVVLHDFEQLEIADSRFEPKLETVLERCVRKYRYQDYTDREKFAEIYWLWSREAVAGGSIEKLAATLTKRRGKAVPQGILSMDEAFLQKLDEHRNELAHAFKNRNPGLDGESLTELVQRTLDRLVFLRFLEDKQIELQRRIACFGEKKSAWEDFITESRRLDGIYNGIVYKKHELLDSSKFKVDDERFRGVCQSLSHKNSAYNFNHVPIHILGSIYERFLGKVIVSTDKRARVEEKPEVRKAGGVYYTPEYIVRYIVENTVGKLIEGKSPAQIGEMRFADIACGSGSFLLGVYDLLLRYHTKYYNENPAKAKKSDVVQRDDGLHLSLQKKRQILVANIYGVDIDTQAVEVAQLSLYLKLLQDETPASAREHQLEFHETLLPSLNKNIVCGNSLIGTDILDGQLFEPTAERKLNPMNFEDAFPHIFKRKAFGELREAAATPLDFDLPGLPIHGNYSDKPKRIPKASLPKEFEGGFDAIVGNPPYIRIQGFPKQQIQYFGRTYESARKNFDIYVLFIEKAFKLLRSGGRFGQIVPNKFFRTDYGEGLRSVLSRQRAVSRIVDFGASQVFDATTYTCLLFLQKDDNNRYEYKRAEASANSLESSVFEPRDAADLIATAWTFSDVRVKSLLGKLEQGIRLLDLPADMSRGSSTGDDEVFVVAADNLPVERAATRIPIYATNFRRYEFTPEPQWRAIFPYEVANGSTRLLDAAEFKKRFPKTWNYLSVHQALLRKRKQFAEWFGYSAPRNLELHDRAHIAVPLLADKGSFALIPKELHGKLCPMASGGFTITLGENCPYPPEFILGLLNSKLLFWHLRQMSNLFRGGWITCTKQYFGELRFPKLHLADDETDKSRHDRMVQMVEQMLEAKKQLAAAQTEKDRTYFENKCASLDRQIDELVYGLYGLTEAEIKIVESASASDAPAPAEKESAHGQPLSLPLA